MRSPSTRTSTRSTPWVAGRGFLFVLGAGPVLVPPTGQAERLAQREALEVLREVKLDEVGVPLEGDPEHLRALALVPVGPAVDARERRHGGRLGPQANVGNDGVAVGEGVDGDEDLEAFRLPVDGREERE